MMSKIISSISKEYHAIKDDRMSKRHVNYDNHRMACFLANSDPLTNEEKDLINAKWGDVIHSVSRGYPFFRAIKALRGFDSDYLPSTYFFPYIEAILNPAKWKRQLAHKSMLQLLYSTGISHPRTLIRTYGANFLDENYKPLTESEAIRAIRQCDQSLLYKPSTDTYQGSGIRLIEPRHFDKLCEDIHNGDIFNKNGDFVLQYLVKQSNDTLVFNPSSLNCMRITTLNLNGKVTVGSRAIKCGPKESVVDNIGDGKRGVIVGIESNGTLCEEGFYGNGDIAKSHNGVTFKGRKIEAFNKVISSALALHELAPACKIIGWDIALDSNNEPVLIESNVINPGITFEQMCSGPIFGDRANEFISYIKELQRRK